MSESNICFFECSLQEWILEEYDNTELKFTFLGRTLDLGVSFEDEEKIKNIQLSSQISGMIKHQSYSIMEHFRLFFFISIESRIFSSHILADSIPLAILGHQLVMEKFAHYDYLTMFPTRKKLPQVSISCP